MHHLLHSAVDILAAWSAFCFVAGLIPGLVVGRRLKRKSRP